MNAFKVKYIKRKAHEEDHALSTKGKEQKMMEKPENFARASCKVSKIKKAESGAFCESPIVEKAVNPSSIEDTTNGLMPMLGESYGLLGRGFRAGFDGEAQADKIVEKLIDNLNENDLQAGLSTDVDDGIVTVFHIAKPKKSIDDFARELRYENSELESDFIAKEFTIRKLCHQLNLVPADLLDAVNAVKGQVGKLPKEKYHELRNNLYPECTSGSKRYRNRAGDKLEAVLQDSKIAENIQQHKHKDFLFADVCGGPGAFSEALFEIIPHLRAGTSSVAAVGSGITLKCKPSVKGSLAWYPSLLKRESYAGEKIVNGAFFPCWGVDKSGNILSEENIEHFAQQCKAISDKSLDRPSGLDLVVADGGFCVDGQEGFQEVFSAHLILCETIIAMKVLGNGGSIVLKVFDTLTPTTTALIYVLTFLFDELYVCKPKRSRVVNSERYIVGRCFNGQSTHALSRILKHLLCAHKGMLRSNERKRVLSSIIPTSELLEEFDFLQSLRKATVYFMKRQKMALEKILSSGQSTCN